MKKSFIRFMSCFLLVAMMVGVMPVMSFASARNCVHTFSVAETKGRTCSKGAYIKYKCDDCGYSYEVITAPSLHEYPDGYSYSETKGDYDIYKCAECSATYKVKTDCVLFAETGAHDPQPEVVLRASCKNLTDQLDEDDVDEYIVSKCASCGEVTCTTGTRHVAHRWATEEFVTGVAPTISSYGVEYKECKDCHYVKTQEVKPVEMTLKPGTTREMIPVYDSYTTSKEIIGYLPAGVRVLVYKTTKDNAFICISETDDQWVAAGKISVGKFGSAAEETSVTSCGHGAMEDLYHKDPTCETGLYKTTRCLTCQFYYEFTYDKTLALGHKDSKGNTWKYFTDPTDPDPDNYMSPDWKYVNDPTWVVVKKPTNTANGEMKRTCAVCGKVEKLTDCPAMQKLIDDHVNKYGVITGADMVSIYDSTESTRKHIGYAVKESKVTIYGYSMDKKWCNVSNDETDPMWIRAEFIKIGGSATGTPVYAGAQYYGTVKTGLHLAVRANPNQTSSELSTISGGSTIAIYELDTNPAWGKVSSTEEKWIFNSTAIDGTAVGYCDLKPVLINDFTIPTTKLVSHVAKGHVTSTVGVNIRKSTSVQSEKLGNLPQDTDVYIYEIKNVGGVEWGKIKRVMPATGTTPILDWGEELTKAALENKNCKVEDAWIALSYVAIDKKVTAPSSTSTAKKDTVIATGVVTSSINLNVRSSPEVSVLNKIGSLASGTKVDIYEIGDANGSSWARIKLNGKDGWVSMNYIQLNSGSTGASEIGATPNATVANCATAVNVRGNADISGNLVGTIPLNTRIAIVELANGWGRVAGKGWVFLDYVKFDAGALDALKNPAPSTSKPAASTSGNLTTYTACSVPAHVTSNIIVYEKTDLASKTVLEIVSGETFNVVDRKIIDNDLWYKISQGSVTGWTIDNTDIVLESFTGTVTSTALNVYKDHSVDSEVTAILGKGSTFEVAKNSQYTEGIYAWAKLKNGIGWIQLHAVTKDTAVNDAIKPAFSSQPSMSGSVITDSVPLYKNHDISSAVLVYLETDTKFTVEDWYYEDGVTFAKITLGQYVGWLKLDETEVEQTAVSGTVTAETVNLYDTYTLPTAEHLQLVARKGEKVTVTERILVGNSVWGRMVAAKDTQKRELWGNLAGITLDGQKATQQETSTPTTPTTPTTPSTSTTPTATVGYVANTETLNVRTAAGARNNLATTLKKGARVNVYETTTVDNALWGRIDEGWVAMMYIDLSNTGSTSGSTISGGSYAGTTIMTSVPSGAVAVGFVNIADLAVRSGAGLGYPKTGSLKKGASVVIYEQVLQGGMIWGRTDMGWICSSYVTITAIGSTGTGTLGTIARTFYTANVRSNPGIGNALVGKVMVNSRVEIYETQEYSGETWGRTAIGWIAMQYVMTDTIPGL